MTDSPDCEEGCGKLLRGGGEDELHFAEVAMLCRYSNAGIQLLGSFAAAEMQFLIGRMNTDSLHFEFIQLQAKIVALIELRPDTKCFDLFKKSLQTPHPGLRC